jgi:hypothetical protein
MAGTSRRATARDASMTPCAFPRAVSRDEWLFTPGARRRDCPRASGWHDQPLETIRHDSRYGLAVGVTTEANKQASLVREFECPNCKARFLFRRARVPHFELRAAAPQQNQFGSNLWVVSGTFVVQKGFGDMRLFTVSRGSI